MKKKISLSLFKLYDGSLVYASKVKMVDSFYILKHVKWINSDGHVSRLDEARLSVDAVQIYIR